MNIFRVIKQHIDAETLLTAVAILLFWIAVAILLFWIGAYAMGVIVGGLF